MKALLWLLTLTLVCLCAGLWYLAGAVEQSWRGILPGEALPRFSVIILLHRTWLLGLWPLPWVIYAVVLTRRPSLSVSALRLFVATACAAMLLIAWAVFHAATVPLHQWSLHLTTPAAGLAPPPAPGP